MFKIVRKLAVGITCVIGALVLARHVPGLEQPSRKIEALGRNSWQWFLKQMHQQKNELEEKILTEIPMSEILLPSMQNGGEEEILIAPTASAGKEEAKRDDPSTINAVTKVEPWRPNSAAKHSPTPKRENSGLDEMKAELRKPLDEEVEELDRDALDALVRESIPMVGAKRERLLPFKKQGE